MLTIEAAESIILGQLATMQHEVSALHQHVHTLGEEVATLKAERLQARREAASEPAILRFNRLWQQLSPSEQHGFLLQELRRGGHMSLLGPEGDCR